MTDRLSVVKTLPSSLLTKNDFLMEIKRWVDTLDQTNQVKSFIIMIEDTDHFIKYSTSYSSKSEILGLIEHIKFLYMSE